MSFTLQNTQKFGFKLIKPLKVNLFQVCNHSFQHIIFLEKKILLSRSTVGSKHVLATECVSSAYFHANVQPITCVIIAFCRSVRLCERRGCGDQQDVLIPATHMHRAQKKKDDQTLSNSSVSLSEKPQSGAAEAIRVNGFAEKLSGFSYKNMRVESIICSASPKK